MNLVEICNKIDAGYEQEKCALDDDMVPLLIDLADRTDEIRKLVATLVEVTPPMPPADAPCHVGLVTQDRCIHCSRVARAWKVIHEAIGVPV